MKKYIANYTDKTSGSSWDLVFFANNFKEAMKEARKAVYGLMAGCRLESVHLER